ncbi:LPS export ABC transporter periplasmic protein LptC [Nitratireductor soli]|uniref:LPS export ABC transporter periplasmic protein LptC n=1 Tax=Nitratireductor soli TaxID=1670619 RepID=UPI00065E4E4B|nr:LPS export ABC transporter periplasmic protein LptC [Nitratireductor soli]
MSEPITSEAKARNDDARRHAIHGSERGADAFARATRHSHRVRLLKFLLPLSAVALTVAFLGYSFLSSVPRGAVDLATASIEGGSLVMSSPELNGFTSDDLPYKMTAERARQKIGGEDIIELEGIRARVPVDKENFATIEAADGVYNRGENRLDIDSRISLKTTSGITAILESAQIDIGGSSLETSKPVEIELDGTRIAADSFAASDGGKVFVFDKRVRVTIDPSQVRQTAKTTEQTTTQGN